MMASTVEQCDTKPLRPLPSTLEMFDTFKTADEDKDSDEESFHIPLLGCDDDTENGKEDVLEANTPNPETEDEILDKFDTSTPTIVDSKLESVLLTEDNEKNSPNSIKVEDSSKISIDTIKIEDVNSKSDSKNEVNRGTDVVVEDSVKPSENVSNCENQTNFLDLEVVDETDGSFEELDKNAEANTKGTVSEDDNKIDQQLETENNQQTPMNEKYNTKESTSDDNQELNVNISKDINNIETNANTNIEKTDTTNSENLVDLQSTDGKGEHDIKEDSPVVNIDEEVLSPFNLDLAQDNSEEDEVNDIQEVKDNLSNDKTDCMKDELSTEKEPSTCTVEESKVSTEETISNPQDAESNSSSKEPEANKDEDEQSKVNSVKTIEDDVECMEIAHISSSNTESLSENGQKLDDENVKEIVSNNECAAMEVDECKNQSDNTDTAQNEIICVDDEKKEDMDVDSSEKIESKTLTNETIEEDMDIDPLEGKVTESSEPEKNISSTDKDDKPAETVLTKDIIEELEQANVEVTTISEEKQNELSKEDKSVDKTVLDDGSTEEQPMRDIECDDLLDITVIRDADEDNASAIAEIANTHSSDKSDNDEQDDKNDNDIDEIEADQEDNLLSDKDEHIEHIDFDDVNVNSCDQFTSTNDNDIVISEHTSDGESNIVSEQTSDSENKDNNAPSESDSQHPPSIDDITEINSNQSSLDTENKGDQTREKSFPATADINEESQSTDLTVDAVDKKSPANKRPLADSDTEASSVVKKKMRMSNEIEKPKEEKKKSPEQKKKVIEEKKKSIDNKSMIEKKRSSSFKGEKMKTLTTFEKFMRSKNMGDDKLTRSDLEQFCLQKICESLVHKTDTGELHQTIKKQEIIIENLRKELQQLSKQTRDLDIVNKKLMNELRTPLNIQKPIVPLKITRSVGLQVKLNFAPEQIVRRKPQTSAPNTPTPRTPTTPTNTTTPANRQRSVLSVSNVVRQVTTTSTTTAPTPRKTPTPAPILTQALQTRQTTPAVTSAVTTPIAVAKRSPNIRINKSTEQKPSTPGVIDLTDDDNTVKTIINSIQQKTIANKTAGTPIKIINKNINILQNKNAIKNNNQKLNNGQPKTVAVGPVKTTQVGGKVGGMQARAVTTIPQGVRLTSAQMKNGIAIPASVVTSSAGGTQLMYVVQPTGNSGSTGGSVQKAVLLNFQPTNGVLTSTINGSAVSVIPSKTTNTMQLKTIAAPRKHPAPLPLPPPAIVNTSLKPLLPKPHLSIRKTDTGIILQWRMPYNLDSYEAIASYQLFAYQETNAAPSTDMWRKVGDVKALALPMACTLTQFADKNKYYFAVRSVDVHKRIGAFSEPEEISL